MMNRDSITEMLTEKLLQGETLKWRTSWGSWNTCLLEDLCREDSWINREHFVVWLYNADAQQIADMKGKMDFHLRKIAENWLETFEGQVCITYHEQREADYEEDDARSLLGDPMRAEALVVRR